MVHAYVIYSLTIVLVSNSYINPQSLLIVDLPDPTVDLVPVMSRDLKFASELRMNDYLSCMVIHILGQ